MMDIDNSTIDMVCNSLNAQGMVSRHQYIRTQDKRDLDLSILMIQAQKLISTMQKELDSR
jgi:hypothetical protein